MARLKALEVGHVFRKCLILRQDLSRLAVAADL
jgi:hypothetical protein